MLKRRLRVCACHDEARIRDLRHLHVSPPRSLLPTFVGVRRVLRGGPTRYLASFLGLALLCAGGGCSSCGPGSRAPRPSVSPGRWTQVSFAPPLAEASASRRTELAFFAWDHGVAGTLVRDDGGGRWFFPHGDAGTARPAPLAQARMPTTPFGLRIDDRYSVDASGFVLARPSLLDEPTRTFSRPLPPDAEARSLRVSGEVGTVWTERGLVTMRGDRAPTLLGGLEGYEPYEAIVDAEGFGVGLFVPEQLAVTRDGGATWRSLALPDAHVRALTAVRDRVFATPGGVRDGLPRDVDPRNGEAIRAVWPRAPEPPLDTAALSQRRTRRSPSRAEEEPFDPSPLRLQLRGGRTWSARHYALDGDRFVGFGIGVGEQPNPEDPPLRVGFGALGEPLAPVQRKPLAGDWNARVAICKDLVAVVSKEQVELFREGAPLGSLNVGKKADVAFDAEGYLWIADVASTRAWGSRLRRVKPSALEDAPVAEQESPVGPEPTTFAGGCRMPALWVRTPGAAARLVGGQLEDVQVVPRPSFPAGIDGRGSLALLTYADATGDRQLYFVPSGERAPLPRTVVDVALSMGGVHGLLSTREAGVLRTDDGGRSWTPIDAPDDRGGSSVICGESRCLLGNSALFEGFAETSAPAPSIAPGRTAEPSNAYRRRRANEPETLPVATRCVRDDTFYRGLAAKEVEPRVGRWLFAAASPAAGSNEREDWLGDTAGQRVALAPPVKDERGVPSWSLPTFFESTGTKTAFREQHTGALVLTDGARTQRRATFDPYRRDLVFLGPALPGVVHEHSDGTWYTVRATHDARGDVLTLGRQPPDESSTRRELFVGSAHHPESVLGFLPGERPHLLLFERAPNDAAGKMQIELRARPLGDDLTLGAATPIPATRGPADQPLRLPACPEAPAPRGAVALLEARDPFLVYIGEAAHTWSMQRVIRVSPTGACVERTAFHETGQGHQPGTLVLAGDGGRGFSTEGGVRCDPVRMGGEGQWR